MREVLFNPLTPISMGTNYYAKLNICPTCRRPEEEIHIGKSSGGWKFMFELNKKYFENIKEMKDYLKDKVIENEYGEVVSNKDFWSMVEGKQKERQGGGTDEGLIVIDGYDFYERNFS